MPNLLHKRPMSGAIVDRLGSPAFKAWFRDSQVVDEMGRPSVLFHGTTAEFSSFDMSAAGADGVLYSVPGIFATTDSELASDYAFNKLSREIGDAMRELQRYKNLNPGDYGPDYELRYQALQREFAQARASGEPQHGGGGNVLPVYVALQKPLTVDAGGRFFGEVIPDAVRRLVEGGHDGLIVNNVIDHASESLKRPAKIVMALDPRQLKSAIGNDGSYDFENPDVRYSLASANDFDRWFDGSKVVKRGDSFIAFSSNQIASAITNGPDVRREQQGSDEVATTESVRAAISQLVRVGPEELMEGVGHIVVATSEQLRANMGTDSGAFTRWFGGSKVVDEGGDPLVVYHGTSADITQFAIQENSAEHSQGFFFTSRSSVASNYAGAEANGPNSQAIYDVLSHMGEADMKAFYQYLKSNSISMDWFGYDEKETLEDNRYFMQDGLGGLDPDEDSDQHTLLKVAKYLDLPAYQTKQNATVMPAFLALKNPLTIDANGNAFHEETQTGWIQQAKTEGRDGLIIKRYEDGGGFYGGDFKSWGLHNVYVAFKPEQIKSAVGNNGDFSPSNPDIRYSALTEGLRAQAWHDDRTNTTVFLADRIAAGREAAVFLHEVVHRHGRQALPQGRWSALVSQVKAWAQAKPQSPERAIHDAAQIRVARAGVAGALADEELFAYAVEEAVAMGIEPSAAAVTGSAQAWLQVVLDSIQRVGERLVGNDLQQLGGQDLVDLAYALAQLDSPVHGFEVRRALQELAVEPHSPLSFRTLDDGENSFQM